MVALKHEMALLLGYSSYSEYILKIMMAKDPQTVQKFEEDLANLIYKKGMSELEDLTQQKIERTGNESAVINEWDVSFYENELIKKNFKLDSEKIR